MRIEKKVIREEMEVQVVCDLCGKTMDIGDAEVYSIELCEVSQRTFDYKLGSLQDWEEWESTLRAGGHTILPGEAMAFCSVCSLILIRRMAEDCKEAFSVALESAKATHGRKEVE